MLEGQNIICISDVNWDGSQYCQQHIMRVLASYNRVVYIERPVSFMTPFRDFGNLLRELRTTLKQLKRWIAGPVRREEGLLIASPPPCLPMPFNLLVNLINQRIMLAWIRTLIDKYDVADPIVITFKPYSTYLCKKLKEKIFIYYCNDDHESHGFWWNKKESIIRRERELIREVDLVFCLTEGFASSRREFNKYMYVVPNGVDEEFISLSLLQSKRIPMDIKGIKKPIIGFFGMIDFRLDVELLRFIAESRAGWSIVLVGPIVGNMHSKISKLIDLPNVYFLGNKNIEEFAAYIGAMDVCLIPIIVSDRTRNVLSLKLFEYAALGKPIVSTDLPELRKYTKNVEISRDRDEFLNNIDDCLGCWNDELHDAAVTFASKNTWRHRAEEISRIIQSHV